MLLLFLFIVVLLINLFGLDRIGSGLIEDILQLTHSLFNDTAISFDFFVVKLDHFYHRLVDDYFKSLKFLTGELSEVGFFSMLIVA